MKIKDALMRSKAFTCDDLLNSNNAGFLPVAAVYQSADTVAADTLRCPAKDFFVHKLNICSVVKLRGRYDDR